MKIRSLKIEKNMLLEEDTTFVFGDRNLIHSDKNAKGKTSLLRLLLYSLGYEVPSTKGLRNFNNITTVLEIENGANLYSITRRFRHIVVAYEQEEINYVLPQDSTKLQELIFSIKDKQLLDNLLGAYYIDQDKGWTLLNRGKAIGNIRFNIEDFLSGVIGANADELKEKIKFANQKIAKYKAMLSLADFQDLSDSTEALPETEESTNKLVNVKNLTSQRLREAEVDLRELKSIRKECKQLPNLIEKYAVCVTIGNKQYPVTKNNITNYSENDEYLKSAIRQKELEIEELKKTHANVSNEINKRRKLVDVESNIEKLEAQLLRIPIDRDGIERALAESKSLKKKIAEELREKVMENSSIDFLDSIIRKYAKELGISYYTDNGKNFIVTSELKKYSGKVLFQITYIFKLAYIALVKRKLGVVLPIIIDSPRSGEILKDASDKMLNIIRRDYGDHQLIVASVFNNYSSLGNCNKIELTRGVFGTLPE